MKTIKSKSEKRLIIEANVNNKPAYFLLDTGASVALINKEKIDKYNLKRGMDYKGTLIGAGGEIENVEVCNTLVDFEGTKIPQFLLADISNIVKSIKKETGIEILGIISLYQMKICNIGINTKNMEIVLG